MHRTARPHRRSVRLTTHDYSHGAAYFLTLCAYDRECILGEIVDGEVWLSDLGQIVEDEWLRTPLVRPGVLLDAFVIMPNHLHGIIMLPDVVGAHSRAPVVAPAEASTGREAVPPTGPYRRPRSLGALVAGFKSSSTKRVNEAFRIAGAPLWQRNYYEHVIRDDVDLDRIRRYIADNPARWAEDEENPLANPRICSPQASARSRAHGCAPLRRDRR